ncbi:primosomal protein N' [Solirubrobacter ginsenosidimutans]|uniref:Replication restart protein PriA n=1 Tax=Solirubrobacter ginsenosidimutans TaxID=490573 RepID=A0A9X3N0H0_9ACTN|nr:primosomal protein N' [Solirubrobacter ginsenosidimutans]MDA0166150.1 primosomal protein N' [Solirubrobacter ginsenosidimutans]
MIARVEPLTTTRRLSGPFDYRVEGAVEVGALVRMPFGHQKLDGVVVGVAETTDVAPEKLVDVTSVRGDSIPRDLVDLALWMAEEYCSTPARALSLVSPPPGKAKTAFWAEATGVEGRVNASQEALLARLPGPAGGDLAALRRLEKRGLVAISSRVARRAPRTNPAADRLVDLSDAQAAALAAIEAAPGASHLLHGVTGSGKTEVYLRAAAEALERGEGVIALVPEIALTPQTVARFAARFGDTVALLHSALSEGERYDEWRRLRTGEARIAVGPRSAVFAPVSNLGLIVVDEEHDASYKHEGDPRYDARHVAAYRAYQTGARLLAGSATPRPETAHSTKRLVLPTRVAGGRDLPPVRVLDMRGSHHSLHPDTRRALGASRKSIVLLNRRGWSNFLSCKSCGKAWECPNCDVALVLHRAEHALACHHCGHRERVPSRCDVCGSLAVARHGAGTERVEAELRHALDVPVFRLDADTAANKDAVPELLARFAAAPEGLLLGTQMVAKGHDFPDVTLGVVLDADSTLRFPDFRAEERTFALIAQLAGRAGRGPRGGRVLVQTTSPDAPSIVAAAQHDSDGFLKGELERRRAWRYPPFSDLIRVVTSSLDDARPAHAAATRLAQEIVATDTELLGPAPLFRLRNRERFQLVLKTTARAEAIAATGAAVEAAARDRAFKDVNFSVDVDPT